jgi:hypothetical protein
MCPCPGCPESCPEVIRTVLSRYFSKSNKRRRKFLHRKASDVSLPVMASEKGWAGGGGGGGGNFTEKHACRSE